MNLARIKEACLLAIVACVPLIFYRGAYDPTLIKLTITQCLLLTAVLACLWEGLRPGKTPLDIPILVYLSLAFVSFCLSSYKWASGDELLRLLTYILVYYLTVDVVRDKGAKKTVTIWLLATAGACLLGLKQHFLGRTPLSSFGNLNFFGGYLVIVFPITVLLLIDRLRQRHLRAGVSLFALLALILISLYNCSSRGAWLGVGAGLYFSLLLGLPKYRRRLLLLLILVIALLPALFMTGLVTKDLQSGTMGVRILVWEGTTRMFRANPIFGTGIGTFKLVYPAYRIPEYFSSSFGTPVTSHAHNEFFEIACEMGVLGLGTFLWLLVTFFRSGQTLTAQSDRRDRTLTIGLLSGIGGLLVNNLVGVNLRFPASGIFLWLLMGVVMAGMPDKSGNYRMNLTGFIGHLRAALDSPIESGNDRKMNRATTSPINRVTTVVASFMRHFARRPAMKPARGRATKLSPMNWATTVVASFMRHSAGRWATKLSPINRAITIAAIPVVFYLAYQFSIKPLVASHYFRVAIAYREKGYWKEAIDLYKKALKNKPDLISAWYYLAFAYDKIGNVDEAISSYEKIKELGPDYGEVNYALGTLYMQKRQWSRAEELFLRSLRLNPYKPKTYNNLGVGYMFNKKFAEAETQFRKALAIDPDFMEAKKNLEILERAR